MAKSIWTRSQCDWIRQKSQLVISEVRLDGMRAFGGAKIIRFSSWGLFCVCDIYKPYVKEYHHLALPSKKLVCSWDLVVTNYF